MKPVALAVIADLRARKLLPVAVLLLALLVIVPVVMLKSSSAAPPVPAAPTAATSTGGLPSPEAALSAADKPLVTLASLDTSSDLKSFEPKNPFKPLRKLADTQTASTADSTGGATTPSAGGGTDSTGAGSGGGSGSSPTTGGGGGGEQSPTPQLTPLVPKTDDTPKTTKPGKKLTYAVDATLKGPHKTIPYRGLPKLTTLPGDARPLLIFLGVDSTGHNAVFLIDSSLTPVAGEGSCSPTPANCGTLKLEPGQVEVFKTDKDERYSIQIDQIREVSVAAAASAARRAERAAKSRARTATGPVRRFAPPIITDLFTGSEQ